MKATHQQSLTTQNVQPLQIQNDDVSTTEQEMRVPCGTGLLDLKHSTRCLQLSSDFDTSAQRQHQPHTRTQRSMHHRQNSSGKEEDREQQYVKTLSRKLIGKEGWLFGVLSTSNVPPHIGKGRCLFRALSTADVPPQTPCAGSFLKKGGCSGLFFTAWSWARTINSTTKWYWSNTTTHSSTINVLHGAE